MILVVVHGIVKGRVERFSASRDEEIRERLEECLALAGYDPSRAGRYAELAEVTGDTRKSVRDWITGATKTMPASFVARLEMAGIVSGRYVLTGEGPRRPVDPSVAVQAWNEVVALVRRVEATEAPSDDAADAADAAEAIRADAESPPTPTTRPKKRAQGQ